MKPLDPIALHPLPAIIAEAQRYTAGGLHRLAHERLDVAVIALLRAAGLGDAEVALVGVLLDAARKGASEYELAELRGDVRVVRNGDLILPSELLLALREQGRLFDHEADLRRHEDVPR